VGGNELINRAKEILDEEFREERRRIRFLTLDDDNTWKQKKMEMWKQEILDNNEHRVVPRAVFMLRKKLKVGLRAHLNYMIHNF
jgi:hypothetical protein